MLDSRLHTRCARKYNFILSFDNTWLGEYSYMCQRKEVNMLEQFNETAGAIGSLLLGVAAIIEATRRSKRKRKKKKHK